MAARRKTPGTVAEETIRGWLENQVRRNQRLIVLCQTSKPIDGHVAGRNRRTQAEAAAIIRLAGSLLDHLDAEAKQARADGAAADAATAAATNEHHPTVP